MSYLSYVAATVGGKLKNIHQFAEAIKNANVTDEDEIINEFKVINIETDFAVFVFYHTSFRWYDGAQETWQNICKMANERFLSYSLLRLGEDDGDVEEDNNYLIFEESECADRQYERRLFSLFSISRKILTTYRGLEALHDNA